MADSELFFVGFALVAGWMVLMCLKTVCAEIEYAVRTETLDIEVEQLRHKQSQRLREIAKNAGDA